MQYGKELVFLEYERGTGASVLEEINIEYKRESHREKYVHAFSTLTGRRVIIERITD